MAGKCLDTEDYLTFLALEMPASAFKGAESGWTAFTALLPGYQVLEGSLRCAPA